MNSKAYEHGVLGMALLLAATCGCSDGAVACKEPVAPAEYDRMLGPPVESVDADGCKMTKPRKRFDGEPVVEEWVWTSGGPVTVNSEKGNIEIVAGSGDGITSTLRPFATLAHDASADQVQAAVESHGVHVVEMKPGAGPAQGILVNSRSSSSNSGADIRIELPPAFDGWLMLDQDVGTVVASFTGNATRIDVFNGGPCELPIGPAAQLQVYCTEIDVTFQALPPGFVSGSLRATDGSATAAFDAVPPGTSYLVYARTSNGTVDTGNASSAGCVVSAQDESSKTVACGERARNPMTGEPFPVYHVSAGLEGDVTLSF